MFGVHPDDEIGFLPVRGLPVLGAMTDRQKNESRSRWRFWRIPTHKKGKAHHPLD